jgi:hypothetical protein
MELKHIRELLPKHSDNILDSFMKIFLDDFTLYNEMESHLQKFILCFQKCREYGISLNPDKCAFIVFSGMILALIVSKEGKLPYPKKIQAIINIPPPKNPH